MATSKSHPLRDMFLIIALPSVMVGGLFYLAGKYVETRPVNQPSISVQGETKVSVEPDLALVTLGVQTGRQETAEAATSTLEETMTAVLSAVGEEGVERKDVQTSNFTLYPAYDWIDGEQVSRGFEASQNVTIKVRTPGKAGAVITAATRAGANNVSGVQFMVEDLDAVKEQARQESIGKAKDQAKKLASELGMRLGKMMSYGEDVSPYYDTSYGKGGYGGGEGMGGAMMDTAVPTGEQEITVRVYMSYELK